MILDRIENAPLYRGLSPLMDQALQFLMSNAATLTPGKTSIKDDAIVASVNDYRARPIESVRLEAHRLFADIQVVLAGRETICWSPRDICRVTEVYDTKRDVEFYSGHGTSRLVLEPGLFAVFLPDDAHAPGGAAPDGENATCAIRKLVIKVKWSGPGIAHP